jgi:predicted metallo-beta-lactamase superfamily hydrolase
MRVIPLAADSLGVRSMATYVECGTARILIDPGAVLAPHRSGLPPSSAEWEALRRANDRISGYAARANLVFVSHYHEEHFRHDPALYAGRALWVKDPAHHVGANQRQRAADLRRAIGAATRWQTADGKHLDLVEAEVTVSPPLPHGEEGTPLGHVVGLLVMDRLEGRRFVFASDVQGPLSAVVTAWLIRQRPHLVYCSGPPAYLERDLGHALIEQGVANCLRLVETTGCRVILDHYAVRDLRYRERFARLWETGRVVTAAGFLGLDDQPLEAQRRELWAAARKPPAPAGPRRPLKRAQDDAIMRPRSIGVSGRRRRAT